MPICLREPHGYRAAVEGSGLPAFSWDCQTALRWQELEQSGKSRPTSSEHPVPTPLLSPQPQMGNWHPNRFTVRHRWPPPRTWVCHLGRLLGAHVLLQAELLVCHVVFGLLCFKSDRGDTWMLQDALFVSRFFIKGLHWKMAAQHYLPKLSQETSKSNFTSRTCYFMPTECGSGVELMIQFSPLFLSSMINLHNIPGP